MRVVLVFCGLVMLSQQAVLAEMGIMDETPAVAASPEDIQWHRQYGDAWQVMKAENRPMLVFIKTNSCVHCERMESATYKNPHVVRDVSSQFVPALINRNDNPKLAQQLGARIYPTTVIISADGRVVDSISGYVSPDTLRRRLQVVRMARR